MKKYLSVAMLIVTLLLVGCNNTQPIMVRECKTPLAKLNPITVHREIDGSLSKDDASKLIDYSYWQSIMIKYYEGN